MDKHRNIYWIALALLLVIGILSIINSSYFEVNEIEIIGNKLVSDQYIIKVCNLEDSPNIFKINRRDIVKKLVKLPQVKGAAINRELPQKLIIKINERRPVAMVGSESAYRIIDSQGWIIDTTKNLSHWNLPLITGVELSNKGKKIKLTTGLKAALAYLSLLSNQTLQEVSKFNISQQGELELSLVEGGVVRLGKNFNLKKKAQVFTSIYQDLKNKKLKVKYIDFRYRDNIVVKVRN